MCGSDKLTFVSTVGKGTKCLRASCVFVFEQSLQLDARPSLDDRTWQNEPDQGWTHRSDADQVQAKIRVLRVGWSVKTICSRCCERLTTMQATVPDRRGLLASSRRIACRHALIASVSSASLKRGLHVSALHVPLAPLLKHGPKLS